MIATHSPIRGKFETLVKSVGTKALASGSEALLIEGYASTPHVDRGDDITLPEAFSRTLELYMTNPVLLWDHGTDHRYGYMPIGQVTDAAVEGSGLRIKAQVTDPEVVSKIRLGELRTMSFGYEIPEGGFYFKEVEGKTVRVITELNLYEISVVAIPMNPHASFSLAKSLRAAFKAFDGARKAHDATNIPSLQPNADRMDDTTPEQKSAPETETPETAAPSPEIETPEVTPETVVEVKAETPTEEETPAVEAEETKTVESVQIPMPDISKERVDAPKETVIKTDTVTVEAPVVEVSTEHTPVDNAESSTAEATDSDTAVPAEPNEKNPAPASAPQVVEVTVASKSMAASLEPEVKSLNARYTDLDAKHAALESKHEKALGEIKSLVKEMKTFDAAFTKLTDLVLRVKKLQDETPVNTPYAVSPGLANTDAPKQKKHWSDEITVVDRQIG